MKPDDTVYPIEGTPEIIEPSYGLTVRDYIAIKAMQGMIANPEYNLLLAQSVAKESYQIADTMIAESGRK
jgi:hypothetical protein